MRFEETGHLQGYQDKIGLYQASIKLQGQESTSPRSYPSALTQASNVTMGVHRLP